VSSLTRSASARLHGSAISSPTPGLCGTCGTSGTLAYLWAFRVPDTFHYPVHPVHGIQLYQRDVPFVPLFQGMGAT
jgi:hypothetical protein